MFLARGFAGTSMAAIASAASCAKPSLYRHFDNKSALFAAALTAECDRMLAEIDPQLAHTGPAALALEQAGQAVLALLLSERAMRVHRLVTLERDASPQLGRLYFDNAVQPTVKRVQAMLAALAVRHELRLGDPRQAAHDFIALLRGQPLLHAELGIDRLDAQALAAHVERVGRQMLLLWGHRPAPADR